MNGRLTTVSLAAGLTTLLASAAAFAQVEAEGSAQVGMGLPGATPATATAAPAVGGSDHDMMVGRLAIGYLGRSSIPVGAVAGGAAADTLQAPVVGVRYWLDRGMGIDAGLGLVIDSGSTESEPGEEVEDPSYFGVILHGGLPLALANGRHYSFQVVPEANIGFASGSAGDDDDHSAFLVDLGARAGAEIHFGFIGVPELSLQGSVGALISIASRSSDDGDVETSKSDFTLRTTVYDNPWNIFTSNVAALYYF